ncbi:MAG: AmmeMemoRadiSam system protein A [Sideroxyarcus sp.]|nr:AmmeMemoRadiSam system protein A [Sideroxyarcus sp.]
MADLNRGQTLLHLARAAIGKELGFLSHELPHVAWLEEPGATFVTLTLRGKMRGCVGSLETTRPLIEDVRKNAVAAAFHDPRFAPLTKAEFAEAVIDVALLSTHETLRCGSEQEALAQLNPGLDGVVLEYNPAGASAKTPDEHPRKATFLPHAWIDLPDPRAYLAHLKSQAGLDEDFWSEDIRLSRFNVRKWREGGRREGEEQHG